MSAASSGAWIPEQEKLPLSNRGAALWGNLVISSRELSAPHHRHQQGNRQGRPGRPTCPTARPTSSSRPRHLPSRTRSSSAPPGATAACATSSSRSMQRPASSLWRKYVIPAPGEPGSETWKDKNNAWQTGGGAMWVTGSYDPDTNQVTVGHRQSGARGPIPTYRPGDNLYTNSLISWNPDTGKMNWYSPVYAGRHVGLRRGRHPHPHRRQIAGQPRKLDHALGAQRLPLHLRAQPTVRRCWPSPMWRRSTGPPASTRRPASRWITIRSGHPGLFRRAEPDLGGPYQEAVPVHAGRQQFLARRPTAAEPGCFTSVGRFLQRGDARPALSNQGGRSVKGAKFRDIERNETDMVMADPLTGEVKKRVRIRPIRITAARWRPQAGSSSPASPTAPLPPMTTRPSSRSGRSMSAPDSTRRR